MTDCFCFDQPPEMYWGAASSLALVPGGETPEGAVVRVLQAIAVAGVVLSGIQIQRRWKSLCCPFCQQPGVGKRHRTEGVAIQCPGCGGIIGGSTNDGTSLPGDEGTLAAHPQRLPARALLLRSPWLWLLFLLSVVSAVWGAAMHSFGLVTVLVPLWSLLVSSRLIHTLQTGCVNGYWSLTFRERQPVKFWLRIGVWFLAYGFALYLPIGFGLRARMLASPPARVEAKR